MKILRSRSQLHRKPNSGLVSPTPREKEFPKTLLKQKDGGKSLRSKDTPMHNFFFWVVTLQGLLALKNRFFSRICVDFEP